MLHELVRDAGVTPRELGSDEGQRLGLGRGSQRDPTEALGHPQPPQPFGVGLLEQTRRPSRPRVPGFISHSRSRFSRRNGTTTLST